MLRFIIHSVPILVVLMALFGLTADVLDLAPRSSMTTLDFDRVPPRILLGTWLLEAFALSVLYLLIEGKTAARWLDGLVAGSLAWVFRGPLLVVTIVVSAGRLQDPWWRLAFGWWVLYSVCGLALGLVAGRLDSRHEKSSSVVGSSGEL